MAQKVNLRVKRINAGGQLYRFQFELQNNDTVPITVGHYRLVTHILCNFDPDDIRTEDQLGQSVFGGAPGGTDLELRTTVDPGGKLLDYFNPSNPISAKPGAEFSVTLRSRFNSNGSGLTTWSPGWGVRDCELTMRHVNYKEWGERPGNKKIYEDSYSYESSTSYVNSVRFILEYNDINPGVANDPNWTVVQQWTSNTTQDPNSGVHPYGGTGSTHQATSSSNVLMRVEDDTWIDSAQPTATHGSDTVGFLWGAKWNGSQNSTRRILAFFDAQNKIPQGNDMISGSLWMKFTSNVISSTINSIDIHPLVTPVNEATANWNSHSGDFSASSVGSFSPLANTSDNQLTFMTAFLNIANLVDPDPPLAQWTGLGLKLQAESGAREASFFLENNKVNDVNSQPFMSIYYQPNSGPGPQPPASPDFYLIT